MTVLLVAILETLFHARAISGCSPESISASLTNLEQLVGIKDAATLQSCSPASSRAARVRKRTVSFWFGPGAPEVAPRSGTVFGGG
jgi:hypothetical protein